MTPWTLWNAIFRPERKGVAARPVSTSGSTPVSTARKGLVDGISLYDDGQPSRRLLVRKFGAGKGMARMKGPAEYVDVAAECLRDSFTTMAHIMEDRFREHMAARGVPKSVVEEFLRSATIDDETFLRSSSEE